MEDRCLCIDRSGGWTAAWACVSAGQLFLGRYALSTIALAVGLKPGLGTRPPQQRCSVFLCTVRSLWRLLFAQEEDSGCHRSELLIHEHDAVVVIGAHAYVGSLP